MPIITISTYSGRTQREKDSLGEAITEDVEQNTVFNPEETNITRGAEIFVGNNSSSPQSITSGTGPDDPLSGKLFDTGVIKSK